jgi:hypothetical protein
MAIECVSECETGHSRLAIEKFLKERERSVERRRE